MIDEESDWISVDGAASLVETALQCYRERARDLLRQAVNNLRVKSRTVNSSPRWIVSEVVGAEVYHSDHGKRVEVSRKDVIEFRLGLQLTATRSSPPKKTALRNSVTAAIADLWPDKEIALRAEDRDNKIHEWLKSREIIGKSEDVTRTIQRVLREQRSCK
jgi:hypothetical protein